jgi:thioredoxin 1
MIEATSKNFNELLQSDLPVLVDFWAEWCGPCRMLAPVLEELSTEYESVFITAKLNSDENAEIAFKHEVRSIPTLILFKGGIEVARMTGAKPKPAIVAWLQDHVELG